MRGFITSFEVERRRKINLRACEKITKQAESSFADLQSFLFIFYVSISQKSWISISKYINSPRDVKSKYFETWEP